MIGMAKSGARPPQFQVIPSGPSGHIERRQVPRLGLTYEQFKLKKTGKVFSVVDISERGMGLRLLMPEDHAYFQQGDLIEGEVNLHREKFSVRAKVRNTQDDLVGLEFEPLSEDTKEAVESLLSPENLGRSLKKMPVAIEGMIWFHGSSSSQLVLRMERGSDVVSWALYFLGSYVSWGKLTGISTGLAHFVPGSEDGESALHRPDNAIDLGKLEQAKRMIASSTLTDALKSLVLGHIRR